MKIIPAKHKLTAYILLAVGILLAAFQVICAVCFYDSSVYLYSFSVVPKILNILLALYVIGVVVVFALLKKNDYPESEAKTPVATRIFAGLCAVSLFVCGMNDLIAFFEFTTDMTHTTTTRQETFIMWGGILSLGAVVYFVLNVIFTDNRKNLKPWFGFVAIVWHIMYLLSIYFDMTNPLNNPIRLINEFALVAGMLFITVELRYVLGVAKKGFYISCSLVAVTFLLASGVTGIICTFTDIIPKTRDLWGYIFELAFAFYVLTRFIVQLSHSEEKPIEETKDSSER